MTSGPVTEPFCHLANRTDLKQRLGRDGGRRRVGMVVVDVDGYRELNQRHGTDIGDRVLVELVSLLVRGTRRDDLIVRLGGATYAVALCPGDERRARRFAERVCRDVAAYPWGDLAANLLVTVSAGVASGTSGEPAGSTPMLAAAKRALTETQAAAPGQVAVDRFPRR